jgi:hypothetical protein
MNFSSQFPAQLQHGSPPFLLLSTGIFFSFRDELDVSSPLIADPSPKFKDILSSSSSFLTVSFKITNLLN